MALLVQKYGGTSVGDAERIRAVADRVRNLRRAGHDVVVVVWGDKEDSQMGISEIALRAKEAAAGIPDETRQALRSAAGAIS